MHFARFRSTRPYDHLPRMLDTLRRMGFEVHRVVMETIEPDLYSIEVVYQPAGHLDPATFVERLQVMPGVCGVTAGSARALEVSVANSYAGTGQLAGCIA